MPTTLGVLNVDSDRKNWFNPSDRPKLRLLERLASQAAFVISSELNSGNFLSTQAMLHQFQGGLAAISGHLSAIEMNKVVDARTIEEIKHLKNLTANLSLFWGHIRRGQVFNKPINPRALATVGVNDFLEWATPLLNYGPKKIDFHLKLDPQLADGKGFIAVDTLQLLFGSSRFLVGKNIGHSSYSEENE